MSSIIESLDNSNKALMCGCGSSSFHVRKDKAFECNNCGSVRALKDVFKGELVDVEKKDVFEIMYEHEEAFYEEQKKTGNGYNSGYECGWVHALCWVLHIDEEII
mgnify:CR=1 FL=1